LFRYLKENYQVKLYVIIVKIFLHMKNNFYF